jgi:hypothetical protein
VQFIEGTNVVPFAMGQSLWIWPKLFVLDTNSSPNVYVCVDEVLLNAADYRPYRWTRPGSIQVRDPRNNLFAPGQGASEALLADWYETHTLWTSNLNCSVTEAPFVHPNAPMNAIGEIGYVYAGDIDGSIDFSITNGAALLDRFAVFPPGTNANYAARNRIQANSDYTNVVRRLFEDIVISRSMTNQPAYLDPDNLATACIQARDQVPHHLGWNSFAQMIPDLMKSISEMGQSETGQIPDKAFIEELVRPLPERVTFRQNIFVIIMAAQRLTPARHRTAEQRAAAVVIRDAYTGSWFIHDWFWLD